VTPSVIGFHIRVFNTLLPHPLCELFTRFHPTCFTRVTSAARSGRVGWWNVEKRSLPFVRHE
jgi:hypothetical protein